MFLRSISCVNTFLLIRLPMHFCLHDYMNDLIYYLLYKSNIYSLVREWILPFIPAFSQWIRDQPCYVQQIHWLSMGFPKSIDRRKGVCQVVPVTHLANPDNWNPSVNTVSGWWLTYPSEKWWSSSNGIIIPNIWEKIMFQTTNQVYQLSVIFLLTVLTSIYWKVTCGPQQIQVGSWTHLEAIVQCG